MDSKLILCKYCQSDHIIKYGQYKGIQRYYCRVCNHKFVSRDTIPKMQYTIMTIANVLDLYYEGMSLDEIRRNLVQQDNQEISKISAYNWVDRFTNLAIKEASNYHPKVSDIWVADETHIKIDKSNIDNNSSCFNSRRERWVVLWDIIDIKTWFLIASHITTTRTTKVAQILMEKAAKRAGKIANVVVTDKLQSYLDGIELNCGSDTRHKRNGLLEIRNDDNLMDIFHGTFKERTRVMRALKNKDNLVKFADGWLVYYNFFRPHLSLGNKTPAEAAGLNFPYHNWKQLIEKQPYRITARIPIKEG